MKSNIRNIQSKEEAYRRIQEVFLRRSETESKNYLAIEGVQYSSLGPFSSTETALNLARERGRNYPGIESTLAYDYALATERLETNICKHAQDFLHLFKDIRNGHELVQELKGTLLDMKGEIDSLSTTYIVSNSNTSGMKSSLNGGTARIALPEYTQRRLLPRASTISSFSIGSTTEVRQGFYVQEVEATQGREKKKQLAIGTFSRSGHTTQDGHLSCTELHHLQPKKTGRDSSSYFFQTEQQQFVKLIEERQMNAAFQFLNEHVFPYTTIYNMPIALSMENTLLHLTVETTLSLALSSPDIFQSIVSVLLPLIARLNAESLAISLHFKIAAGELRLCHQHTAFPSLTLPFGQGERAAIAGVCGFAKKIAIAVKSHAKNMKFYSPQASLLYRGLAFEEVSPLAPLWVQEQLRSLTCALLPWLRTLSHTSCPHVRESVKLVLDSIVGSLHTIFPAIECALNEDHLLAAVVEEASISAYSNVLRDSQSFLLILNQARKTIASSIQDHSYGHLIDEGTLVARSKGISAFVAPSRGAQAAAEECSTLWSKLAQSACPMWCRTLIHSDFFEFHMRPLAISLMGFTIAPAALLCERRDLTYRCALRIKVPLDEFSFVNEYLRNHLPTAGTSAVRLRSTLPGVSPQVRSFLKGFLSLGNSYEEPTAIQRSLSVECLRTLLTECDKVTQMLLIPAFKTLNSGISLCANAIGVAAVCGGAMLSLVADMAAVGAVLVPPTSRVVCTPRKHNPSFLLEEPPGPKWANGEPPSSLVSTLMRSCGAMGLACSFGDPALTDILSEEAFAIISKSRMVPYSSSLTCDARARAADICRLLTASAGVFMRVLLTRTVTPSNYLAPTSVNTQDGLIIVDPPPERFEAESAEQAIDAGIPLSDIVTTTRETGSSAIDLAVRASVNLLIIAQRLLAPPSPSPFKRSGSWFLKHLFHDPSVLSEPAEIDLQPTSWRMSTELSGGNPVSVVLFLQFTLQHLIFGFKGTSWDGVVSQKFWDAEVQDPNGFFDTLEYIWSPLFDIKVPALRALTFWCGAHGGGSGPAMRIFNDARRLLKVSPARNIVDAISKYNLYKTERPEDILAADRESAMQPTNSELAHEDAVRNARCAEITQQVAQMTISEKELAEIYAPKNNFDKYAAGELDLYDEKRDLVVRRYDALLASETDAGRQAMLEKQKLNAQALIILEKENKQKELEQERNVVSKEVYAELQARENALSERRAELEAQLKQQLEDELMQERERIKEEKREAIETTFSKSNTQLFFGLSHLRRIVQDIVNPFKYV